MLEYIGEDCLYTDPIMAGSIVLEKNKFYDVFFKYEGPLIMINGKQVLSLDGTIWVTVQQEGKNPIRIPYAPDLVKNFWKVD